MRSWLNPLAAGPAQITGRTAEVVERDPLFEPFEQSGEMQFEGVPIGNPVDDRGHFDVGFLPMVHG
jgi:hypothetical protein